MKNDPTATDPRVPLGDRAKAQAEAQAEARRKSEACFDRLSKTDSGILFLRSIYTLAKMWESPIIYPSGGVPKLNLVVVGHQEVWKDLSPFIPNEAYVTIKTGMPFTDKVKTSEAFGKVANTEDGLFALKFIYQHTGASGSIMVMNRTTLNLSYDVCVTLAGRQQMWNSVCDFLPLGVEAKILTKDVVREEVASA